MNNKALMGVCAVVIVAILAGTYLWLDADDDEDTRTWHMTHYEYVMADGTSGILDAEVSDEVMPLTINQVNGCTFLGYDDTYPIMGVIDYEYIMFEYQYEYQSTLYNLYAEGIVYDDYINLMELVTDFDTGELICTLFIQYTLDGKPAASIEDSYFDFNMPFTTMECMHYQDDDAYPVPSTSLVFKNQMGMIATFDMEIDGVTGEIVLIGNGYYEDGCYCATGYGCIDGDYGYITVHIADGEARFLYSCTTSTGEAYYISSSYEVPYQEGEQWEAEDIEGTWTCDISALYADGNVKHIDTEKVVEKIADNYYICTEVTADDGTFTWYMYTDGNFIEVRVFNTYNGTTEEIGFLIGNSHQGYMDFEGLMYRSGYVNSYAVSFHMMKNA